MEKFTIYCYLIKELDYINISKDYSKLCKDIVAYLPELKGKDNLDKYLIKKIKKRLKGKNNKNVNDIFKYIKEYKSVI